MSNRFRSIALIALASCLPLLPATAQQNWLNNAASQIQQDAGSGLINGGQAANLQNRENQIQSQENQYLQQNGGKLTSPERHQIQNELRGLQNHLGGDVARNTGAVPPGYPGYYSRFSGQNAPFGFQPTGMPFTGYPTVAPGTVYPAQYQTAPGQYPNQYHHHHYHDGAWGQNGNQQIWGH
jgi:hypothetical protein